MVRIRLKSLGRFVKHDQNGLSRSSEYQCWKGIKARCHNPKHRNFHNYGGKGIVVCDHWRYSFLNFYADMGQKPTPEHTIDRIESTGNYEPGNYRWATWEEQVSHKSNNVHVTYRGEKRHLSEWVRRTGISYFTLHRRIFKLCWSVEKAFNTPLDARKQHFGKRAKRNGKAVASKMRR